MSIEMQRDFSVPCKFRCYSLYLYKYSNFINFKIIQIVTNYEYDLNAKCIIFPFKNSYCIVFICLFTLKNLNTSNLVLILCLYWALFMITYTRDIGLKGIALHGLFKGTNPHIRKKILVLEKTTEHSKRIRLTNMNGFSISYISALIAEPLIN